MLKGRRGNRDRMRKLGEERRRELGVWEERREEDAGRGLEKRQKLWSWKLSLHKHALFILFIWTQLISTLLSLIRLLLSLPLALYFISAYAHSLFQILSRLHLSFIFYVSVSSLWRCPSLPPPVSNSFVVQDTLSLSAAQFLCMSHTQWKWFNIGMGIYHRVRDRTWQGKKNAEWERGMSLKGVKGPLLWPAGVRLISQAILKSIN